MKMSKEKRALIAGMIGCLLYVIGDFLFSATGKSRSTESIGLINDIYLYDDKVLITFNYREGTETVAFGEAVKAEKSSDMSARGAPDFERQIVRFDVFSLYRKAAAHFLHTVCTFARIGGFSAQGLHGLLSFS